jgi:NADPH-dependent 2,4-dienoyl-CoA reductase/sulfur reductase-like enzyme
MALCLHNPSTGREIEQPHEIAPAGTPRRVVIVGAGPAGLEAARVAALRGHEVIVHEAANDPGGQVRLTAQTPRRAEMMQLVQWRVAECERLGVTFHYNSFADAETVADHAPDVVIVATGGLPHVEVLREGDDLVTSTWDILSGDVRPGANVLIYDDAGDYPALQAAEKIAATGAKVEVMTRDRNIVPEVMAMSLTPALQELQARDVTFTVTWRLDAVRRDGNELVADIGSDYGGVQRERRVDQVVVNHGTRPLDDLYFDLRPGSSNLGEVDYDALIANAPQTVATNPDGTYRLFRIGDAVAARNTHAAIYDALRLARAL